MRSENGVAESHRINVTVVMWPFVLTVVSGYTTHTRTLGQHTRMQIKKTELWD